MEALKNGIELTGTLYTSAQGDAKDKLAYAEQIWDDEQQKHQSEINKELAKNIGDIPAADEEDITVTADNKLQLKDRDTSKGMGYKILRLPENGILTQEMINEPNTIYEIRYDFDLNGATITIPENCTLKFEGGVLENGTVYGTNTRVQAGILAILSNIELSGSWRADESYPEWFGGISNSEDTNNSAYINICLSKFKKCILTGGLYYVNSSSGSCIQMQQGEILTSKLQPYSYNINDLSNKIGIILMSGSSCNSIISATGGVQVSNIYIIPNNRNVTGLEIKGSRATIDNVIIVKADIGLRLEGYLTTLKSVCSAICNIGFKITGNYKDNGELSSENTSISLIGCYASECKDAGYYISNIVYSNLINCSCDNTGTKEYNDNTFKAAYYLYRCKGVNLIGCGAEHNIKLLYSELCVSSYYNIHQIANYSNIVAKGNSLYSKYIEITMASLCDFKVYGEIYGAPDNTPFIYLFDYSRNTYNTISCSRNELTVSCSGNLADTIKVIERNTILTKNFKEFANSLVYNGKTDDKPTEPTLGLSFFDTSIGRKVYWNGTEWVDPVAEATSWKIIR